MIPAGLCQCGCGERTPVAKKTSSRSGHIVGQPLRFLPGHNRRIVGGGLGGADPNRPRCKCGCGHLTPIATHNDRARGHHRGQPMTYLPSHEPASDARFVEAAAEIVMAVHDGGPDEFREHLTDALALDAPDGVTPVEALVAALAALVDPDTRTATVTPVRAYLVALQETAGAA